MKWPVATIGEVCEVVSGATPKTGKPEFWDGNVPWVTPKDLSELGQKYLSDTPRKITRAGLESCSARMLPAQSVLFSSRAPIGLVAINTLPVCTNQGFKNLVPRFDLVSPDFLFWWLKTQEKHIQSKGRGATFKEVSKKIVEDLQISLPPLAEQKRIAGILDAADALRAKRREALAQLDTLIQSTFLDMFGDPVTNPMEWERKPLGEVTSIDAPMVNPTEEQYRGLLHYGPDRIKKGTGELLPALTAEEDELISGKFLCTPGEILYSKIRPYLNKVALVKQPCLCSADVYPVSVSPESLCKEYLWFLLRSQAFLDYVAGFSRRANIPKLNRKQFAGYSAPLPPLDLQHRFADIVESVEQQKARQRAHLDELDTLFGSLQSRAFCGDL